MMKDQRTQIIFNNERSFTLISILNLLLIATVLVYLILYFQEKVAMIRTLFLTVLATQIANTYLLVHHFVSIGLDDKQENLVVRYKKNFSLWFSKNATESTIPLTEFDRVELQRERLFNTRITFYKKVRNQTYSLGPFNLGPLSRSQVKSLKGNLEALIVIS